MHPDLRRRPRELTFRTGKIRFNKLAADIDCAVLNVHEEGACLLVPDGNRIPENFELAIDGEPVVHTCRVVWRSGHRLGVSLQSTAPRASVDANGQEGA
jgi:hypothetical protein